MEDDDDDIFPEQEPLQSSFHGDDIVKEEHLPSVVNPTASTFSWRRNRSHPAAAQKPTETSKTYPSRKTKTFWGKRKAASGDAKAVVGLKLAGYAETEFSTPQMSPLPTTPPSSGETNAVLPTDLLRKQGSVRDAKGAQDTVCTHHPPTRLPLGQRGGGQWVETAPVSTAGRSTELGCRPDTSVSDQSFLLNLSLTSPQNQTTSSRPAEYSATSSQNGATSQEQHPTTSLKTAELSATSSRNGTRSEEHRRLTHTSPQHQTTSPGPVNLWPTRTQNRSTSLVPLDCNYPSIHNPTTSPKPLFRMGPQHDNLLQGPLQSKGDLNHDETVRNIIPPFPDSNTELVFRPGQQREVDNELNGSANDPLLDYQKEVEPEDDIPVPRFNSHNETYQHDCPTFANVAQMSVDVDDFKTNVCETNVDDFKKNVDLKSSGDVMNHGAVNNSDVILKNDDIQNSDDATKNDDVRISVNANNSDDAFDEKSEEGLRSTLELFLPSKRKGSHAKRLRFVVFLLKYILFLLNFLFWVTSVAAIVMGSWVLSERGQLVRDSASFFLDPSAMTCLLGAITFLVAFIGCLGALRENISLLRLYQVSMVAVLVLEFLIGTMVFAFYQMPEFRRQLKAGPEEVLTIAIRRYHDDDELRRWIDLIQTEFKCCGARHSESGYQDWKQNAYFNCSADNPSAQRCGVPQSCCIIERGEYINDMCGYGTTNKLRTDVFELIHTQGCMKGLGRWMSSHDVVIGAVSMAIIVPQIVCVIFARLLVQHVRRQRVRWRWRVLQDDK